MDFQTYNVFLITALIVYMLAKRFSKKLYPDKKDEQHRYAYENIIGITFLITSLWWLIVSTILSFVGLL